MDHQENESGGRLNSSTASPSSDVSTSDNNAEQRESVIEWIKCIFPSIRLPTNASNEELRNFLIDGAFLCHVLNRFRPGSVTECECSDHPPESCSENIKRFLVAMDEMGLPRFQISDIEKGSMKIVFECLLTLKVQFTQEDGEYNISNGSPLNIGVRSRFLEGPRSLDCSPRGDSSADRKGLPDFKLQRALRSSMVADQSAAFFHHKGHKLHEVFQMKNGCYSELPSEKILEMMKSNILDNAPTQQLLSVVNGILNESIERKSGEIPLV